MAKKDWNSKATNKVLLPLLKITILILLNYKPTVITTGKFCLFSMQNTSAVIQ